MVFDVRFLPNPYYIDELKEFNGNDDRIKEYVFKWSETTIFLEKTLDMLSF